MYTVWRCLRSFSLILKILKTFSLFELLYWGEVGITFITELKKHPIEVNLIVLKKLWSLMVGIEVKGQHFKIIILMLYLQINPY